MVNSQKDKREKSKLSRMIFFFKSHLFLLILNLVSLLFFLKIAEEVITKDRGSLISVTSIDTLINTKMVLFWNYWPNLIMILITNIGDTISLAILSAIVFGILVYRKNWSKRKKWSNALLLILGMGGGLFLELLIKAIVQRARPENTLIENSTLGYSFPSGHATMSIIFFSLLIYLFKDEIKNHFKTEIKSKVAQYSFIVGSILLFLLIGFSRIYLNVHWFSDVMAGFALGLFWTTLMVMVVKKIGKE